MMIIQINNHKYKKSNKLYVGFDINRQMNSRGEGF